MYSKILVSLISMTFVFDANIRAFWENQKVILQKKYKEMSKKQTTPQQFRELVNFMVAHPDIGRGVSQQRPEVQNELWNELTQKLNSTSLPTRDAAGWKKVWRDFKANTKKKMVTNKQQMTGTGGGPNKTVPLNDLEEAVCELLDLKTSVSGLPTVLSFGFPEPMESSGNVSFSEMISISDDDNPIHENQNVSSKEKAVPTKKNEQLNLLQSQILMQKEFYENYVSLKREELRYLKKIAEGIQKIIEK